MSTAKGPIKALVFLQETKSQLKKVTWPSRQESLQMTATVIGVSLLMAAFIGALDFIFTQLIGVLIK